MNNSLGRCEMSSSFFFFALCSFELTGVAGNSIRPSEEEKKSIERHAADCGSADSQIGSVED